MRDVHAMFLMIFYSTYEQLLEQMNHPSLYNRRIHDILILVYKSIHGFALKYISYLFSLRSSILNLRGYDSLIIPRVNTTKYGLHSLIYIVLVSFGTHYM